MALKKDTGEVDIRIRDGKDTLLRLYKEIQVDVQNLHEPCAQVEASIKKTVPMPQPFWSIQASASVRVPCNADPYSIYEAFQTAWKIVNAESTRGVEIAQQELIKKFNADQPRGQAQPQEQQEQQKAVRVSPDDLPDDLLIEGWEIE